MAAGCAEIALALVHLLIISARFQAVAHRNPYPSVIQWRPCSLNPDDAGSVLAKRGNVPGGARWVAPGSGVHAQYRKLVSL